MFVRVWCVCFGVLVLNVLLVYCSVVCCVLCWFVLVACWICLWCLYCFVSLFEL